jgi:hypothetical protein
MLREMFAQAGLPRRQGERGLNQQTRRHGQSWNVQEEYVAGHSGLIAILPYVPPF